MAFEPTAQGGIVVTGIKELDAALRELGIKGTKRLAASGIRAGLTVIAGAIRAEVNATPLDTPNADSLKRGMRRLVRSRGPKKGRAKVGFGVGMKGDARSERRGEGKTRGVGVAGATVHWFAATGRQAEPKMEPQFRGVVARAHAASAEPALQRALQKMRQRLPVEAARARKRGGK